MTDDELETILLDPGIIRNRLKIEGAITNAKILNLPRSGVFITPKSLAGNIKLRINTTPINPIVVPICSGKLYFLKMFTFFNFLNLFKLISLIS